MESYSAKDIEVKIGAYLHVKLAAFCFIWTQILKGFCSICQICELLSPLKFYPRKAILGTVSNRKGFLPPTEWELI